MQESAAPKSLQSLPLYLAATALPLAALADDDAAVVSPNLQSACPCPGPRPTLDRFFCHPLPCLLLTTSTFPALMVSTHTHASSIHSDL